MIGGDLFQRFFLRFLVGLVLAFLLFLPLVHIFQKRIVDAEWREDLRQQAHWSALHTSPATAQVLANAWKTMHSTIRWTLFDNEGQLVADSHPEGPLLDLDALRQGQEPKGALAAVQPLRNGQGWLVVSRPRIPSFPRGLQWELIAAAILLVALVAAFLYPLVRSLSSTLRQLTGSAEQVAAGHFGKTLEVDRTDELGALVRAFNDMSGKLAEAERLNTRLLHDVSHELRSPLGRIRVMAETIALRPDEADDCLHGIEQEVALLDRLVGDLVETARIESDTRSARPETFSLLHWADETLRRLENEARSRQIGWTTRMPDPDRDVDGDPQRLAQAVANLVDNAISALEGRADPRIEVSIAVADGHWSLAVEDNGPGIPEDDLPHVFRRFYRADEHRSRERGGVGLGLSLVRSIARAHGGEASIESRPDEGTRVTLILPMGRG